MSRSQTNLAAHKAGVVRAYTNEDTDTGGGRPKTPVNLIMRASHLKKSFGETEAMRGISLDIGRGEVLAIMGPSGSGKSTLLHCLAGIIRPDHGRVEYNGRRIDNLSDRDRTKLRRQQFGFVFQFSQLVPELTALDNVAVPLLLNGHPRHVAYDQAEHWLDKMGVHAKRNDLATKLSGGQIQRVAVARAMAIGPEILFADEPTGSLDSINSEKVMQLFIDSAKENGTTVIMVTHEPTIAAYADREVIVRDGRIESGSEILQPETRFAQMTAVAKASERNKNERE